MQEMEKLLETRQTPEEKLELLGLLYDLEKNLNSIFGMDELIPAILDKTTEIIKAEAGAIFTISGRRGDLIFKAASGPASEKAEKFRIKKGEGIVGWVVENQQPLIVDDVAGDPRFFNKIDEKTGFKTKSIICIPLKVGDKTFGAIEIINKKDNTPFNEDDLKLLSGISERIAVALEIHTFYDEVSLEREELEEKVKEFAILYDLSRDLTSTLSYEKLLEMVARYLARVIDYDVCSFLIVGEEAGAELIMKTRGKAPELLIEQIEERIKMEMEIVAEQVQGISLEMAVRVGEIEVEGLPKKEDISEMLLGYYSVPLNAGERILGLINVSSSEIPDFSEDVLRVLAIIANQAAMAISNSKLHSLTEKMATTDGLTGLCNHRTFQDLLSKEIQRSKRYGESLSFILLDIDHFKKFNDTYGHRQGDVVLKEVAKTIKDSIRQVDIAARYGGEEFCCILPKTDKEGGKEMAERIRTATESYPFHRLEDEEGKGPLHVTVSLGVATFPHPEVSLQSELIERADQGLYEAKEGGRNRVVCLDDKSRKYATEVTEDTEKDRNQVL